MAKFFSTLHREQIIGSWIETLDWLFDDQKFSEAYNWNRGYLSNYTKRVKKLKGIADNKNIVYPGDASQFPDCTTNRTRKRSIYIMMTAGDSFTKDLIRHIRNGIAHGSAVVYKYGEKTFLEITDFSDNSKSVIKKTAFINIPLEFVLDLYRLYCDINNSVLNTKEKDRKATKRYKTAG